MAATNHLRSNHYALPAAIGVREVMGIAWPIMVSMLSFTAMNFVNALWVGPLGKEAFGAVGLGAVMLYAIHGFGYGALIGLKPFATFTFCFRTRGLSMPLTTVATGRLNA